MIMTLAQLALVFSCTRAIADEEVGDHQLVDIGGHKMVDIGGHKMADIGGRKVVTSLDKLLGEKRGGLM